MEDFTNSQLSIGDTVIYMLPNLRKLSYGQIVQTTLKTCQIKDISTGNISTQKHSQLIKALPDKKTTTKTVTAVDTPTYHTLIDSFSILNEIFNRKLVSATDLQAILNFLSLNSPESWFSELENLERTQ